MLSQFGAKSDTPPILKLKAQSRNPGAAAATA
jgi:hypothetical protein